MSLNFDLTGCDKSKLDSIPDDLYSDVKQSVIFNMMFVGVRTLETDADCERFFTRYIAKHAVDSAGHQTSAFFLTWEWVKAFQGATTNVSTMTDAAFKKEMALHLMGNSWKSFVGERANY